MMRVLTLIIMINYYFILRKKREGVWQRLFSVYYDSFPNTYKFEKKFSIFKGIRF